MLGPLHIHNPEIFTILREKIAELFLPSLHTEHSNSRRRRRRRAHPYDAGFRFPLLPPPCFPPAAFSARSRSRDKFLTQRPLDIVSRCNATRN